MSDVLSVLPRKGQPQAHYTISLHYTMFPAAFNPVIEMLFFPNCIDKSRLIESTKMNIITCMCI